MDTLRTWNYAAAAVHTVATIVAVTVLTDKSKRTVQMTRLKFNPDETTKSRIDIPVSIENDVKIDLKFIIVAFFGITAAAHFLYASDFKQFYSKQVLGFGWNPYRWFEYSLTAGLMIYLISAASGTKDQVSAISAALITPGIMVSGFTNERALKQNALHAWSIDNSLPKPDIDASIVWSNLIPAWALFGVHWYIILANYAKIVKEAKTAGKEIDKSVQFMVYSQLAFFSLFGVIQTYQVYRWNTSRKGRTEVAYIGYEKAYIALSAITKLALGATVLYSLRN